MDVDGRAAALRAVYRRDDGCAQSEIRSRDRFPFVIKVAKGKRCPRRRRFRQPIRHRLRRLQHGEIRHQLLPIREELGNVRRDL